MWLFALLLSAFIIGRAVWPMRVHFAWKIVLTAFTLVAAFKFQLMHWFGGPMFFAPELPQWIQLSAAWCYAVVFLFFFLLLIAETVRLFFRLFRRKTTASIHSRINLGLLLIAVLSAAAGVIQGTVLPDVRETTLRFSNLPAGANGMTVAVLADLHADGITGVERIRAIVEKTNALNPDLIVIVGDLVDGTVEQRGADLEPLRELNAQYGVFGVPGNHEYYSGYTEWMNFLPTLNIRMLANEHVELPNGIMLGGVTDPAASRMGETPPDVELAMKNVGAERFKLLLAHQPILAWNAVTTGVSLQLSGHTHGGMIWGIDQIVAGFNGGFVSGLYRLENMKLYVSNGAGIWNGFPIRLGRNAEIVLLRLVSEKHGKNNKT